MSFTHLQKKSGFVILSEDGQKIASKYMTRVDKNGLIQVMPRPQKHEPLIPIFKLLFLFVGLMIAFKALALISVGYAAYEEQRAFLIEGNVFEQIGAVFLDVDPVTQFIVEKFGHAFD